MLAEYLYDHRTGRIEEALKMKQTRFSVPMWVWRLSQFLLLFYGLTFVGVPLMGVVAVTATTFIRTAPPNAWVTLWQMAWMIPFGVLLLWLARVLGRVIGDVPTPDGWLGMWRRALRAVFLPKLDDELHIFTVCIEQPLTQVVVSLEQLPSPRYGYIGALTRRQSEPMANVQGEQIEVVAGIGAAGCWQGTLEADGDYTLVRGTLQGAVRTTNSSASGMRWERPSRRCLLWVCCWVRWKVLPRHRFSCWGAPLSW